MSPLFAAMPPDLPTTAYLPTALHTAELLASTKTGTHTVRSGDTVYAIAARYGVSMDAIVRANGLKDGGRWILPGTTLLIPGAKGSTTAVAHPPTSSKPAASKPATSKPTSSGSGTRITVRHGDTLSHLAARHGTTVAALARANNLTNTHLIFPGQTLLVPGASAPAKPTAPKPAAPSKPTSGSSSGGTVTVRSGDTLSGIAARHGVSLAALTSANGINARDLIFPGQKLRLPAGASGGSSSSSGSSSSGSTSTGTLTRPYDPSNIGDIKKGEKVPDTFLHYRYSDGVARSAAANREYLASIDVPSREAMRKLIVETSKRYGVDPTLMVALSYQESGWNMRAVSPANAIGAMQVIPTSGEWASALIGRELNLLNPQDNVTAGVVIMRALQSSTTNADHAIGGYYQGLGSVRQYGLFADTKQYVKNIRYLMTTL